MDGRKVIGLSILTALREYCIDQQKYYNCKECVFSQGNSCMVTIPSENVIHNLKEKVTNTK